MTTDIGRYSDQDLKAALLSGDRKTRYRYEVLTKSYVSRGMLQGVQHGTRISYNYLAEIKRTGELTLREDPPMVLANGEIKWSSVDLSDFLKPYYQLKMYDGLWASWSLGVFLMDSSKRSVAENTGAMRTIPIYDQMSILDRDTVGANFKIAAGAVYTEEIERVLTGAGIKKILITASTSVLPADRTWEEGTKKTVVINELLDSIGYGSIFFDAEGVATCKPYVLPFQRPIDFIYVDDERSILADEAEETLPLWEAPNRC
jgi:hypothetical protein